MTGLRPFAVKPTYCLNDSSEKREKRLGSIDKSGGFFYDKKLSKLM